MFAVLRAIVFLAALGWLYYSIGDSFSLDDLRFTGELHWLLILVILMPLNSFLEILKWKLLTRKFAPSSLLQTTKGVLVGNFYTLFTPNRVGDGIGRMHYIPKGMKTRASYAFINGSIAQTIVTLSCGALALIFAPAWLRSADHDWFNALSWLRWPVYIGTLVLILLYVEPGWMRVFRDLLPEKGWLGKRVMTLQSYARRESALILILSGARYVIFAGQFLAAMHLYGYSGLPEEALARIAVIYLLTTLIPTAALAEFGLRESLAVLLLPAAGMRPEAAFSAAFLLYLVNIGIPALAGGLLFTRMKKLHNA